MCVGSGRDAGRLRVLDDRGLLHTLEEAAFGGYDNALQFWKDRVPHGGNTF